MHKGLGGTAGMSLLTGWSAEQGVDVVVTEHAVEGALLDRQVAVCGSALPVVDRRRPWVAQNDVCCEHCLEKLARSAA
jgi:hypothetical protein